MASNFPEALGLRDLMVSERPQAPREKRKVENPPPEAGERRPQESIRQTSLGIFHFFFTLCGRLWGASVCVRASVVALRWPSF